MPTAIAVAPVVPSSRLRTTSSPFIGRWPEGPEGLSAALSPGPVETSGGVPLEVGRNKFVAGLAQCAGHASSLSEQARYVHLVDLDPRDIAMVADPNLREPERLQRRLCGFDLAQRRHCHRRTVRNSRRQTGKGRLVPVRETKRARRRADL